MAIPPVDRTEPFRKLRIQCLALQDVAAKLNEQMRKISGNKETIIPSEWILDYNARILLRPFEKDDQEEVKKIKATFDDFKQEICGCLSRKPELWKQFTLPKIKMPDGFEVNDIFKEAEEVIWKRREWIESGNFK